ncbi:MAG: hypothetical protein Q4B31_04035 [Clostridia bacterium]|nr:hypothetical protein [Clostridia bacterium]
MAWLSQNFHFFVKSGILSTFDVKNLHVSGINLALFCQFMQLLQADEGERATTSGGGRRQGDKKTKTDQLMQLLQTDEGGRVTTSGGGRRQGDKKTEGARVERGGALF